MSITVAFLGILRSVAVVVAIAGAAGSMAFMFRVGHRAPGFLLVLFALWILSPFVALIWANMVSHRWSLVTSATLFSLTLALTLASVAVYGAVALGPRRSTPAFWFLVVPLASWLLMTTVVPLAAWMSRRRGAGG
jgi:hypothetical protein